MPARTPAARPLDQALFGRLGKSREERTEKGNGNEPSGSIVRQPRGDPFRHSDHTLAEPDELSRDKIAGISEYRWRRDPTHAGNAGHRRPVSFTFASHGAIRRASRCAPRINRAAMIFRNMNPRGSFTPVRRAASKVAAVEAPCWRMGGTDDMRLPTAAHGVRSCPNRPSLAQMGQ
jgi:hypothetical protein